MKRNILIAAVFVLLAGAAIYSNMRSDGTAAADSPKIGFAAPTMMLPDLQDKMVRVGGASPKLTLVNFWASWCGPCLLEAPDLQRLHDEYGEELTVYGINATSFDREREARAFVDEQALAFPILMDRKGKAVEQFKIRQFPTSLLLDRDGNVIDRVEGVIDRKKWERLIERQL